MVVAGCHLEHHQQIYIYYTTGSVGIGTTDPLTYKLNVGGDLNVATVNATSVSVPAGYMTTLGMTLTGTTTADGLKVSANGRQFLLQCNLANDTRLLFGTPGTGYGYLD